MGHKLKLIGFLLFFSIAVSTTVLCQHPAHAREENVKIQAGESAPPFSVNTLEGQTVTLDDDQGKVLILDFFASWCAPCKDATPELQSVRENFSSENLAVLSIESSPSVPVENVRSFKSEYGGDWAFAKSPDMADNYGIKAYPTLFIIGPDGYVDFRNEGAVPSSVLSDVVADILGTSPPSSGTSGENKAPSNMIIDVKIKPENAGGIVATNLKIKKTGEPVFTYKVRANPGYEFAGWTGDVPENQENSPTLEIIPTAGSQVTAKFAPLENISGGAEKGAAGPFAPVPLALGAVIAGSLGVLSGYLAWGHKGTESEEN